ncbi:MAG: SIS domain-containing protein [Eubacterium sp.]|nr:SIS domain-containing protein [Eubacterium sp.]
MNEKIYQIIEQKKQILDRMLSGGYFDTAARASLAIADCILAGNKVILAGNGGSAADAQHFAGEFIGRFLMERRALPAVSLCTDPSVMTCIGNDYGFDAVFERQLSGIGKNGDLFIAISTSGNSANLCRAAELAKRMGMQTVGLLGKDGGRLAGMCDYALVVPAEETPRIQEMHTFTVHLLCGEAEAEAVRRESEGEGKL